MGGDPRPLVAARVARLRQAMAVAGQDAVVLTSAGAVRYATGAVPVHGDSSVEAARPFAAVVTAHRATVLGIEPEFVPPDIDVLDAGGDRPVRILADLLDGSRRVGVERLPLALADRLQAALPAVELVGAETSLVPARRVKTDEEVALLHGAQEANEAAVVELLPAIEPGVREVELTGRFLAAMARRGVVDCHVEPLWCVLPRRAAEAPWTFAGGLPYRELPGGRVLARGDQVMIDTGMLRGGYMSDFGCTWVCGGEPGPADRRLRTRWQAIVEAVLAVCRPGATAADLHRAARAAGPEGGPPPWPRPLYLAHSIGLGGVEPPFIGTDVGLAAEEAMVLVPGMVLVLEPYVWEEGAGGYRAEQTIAVTATGHRRLSAPPP